MFLVSLFSREITLCPPYSYSDCAELFDNFAETIFISLPLLLFSLITYKMREEVFRSWFRFVCIYIPIAILLIALAPSYTHNWMFPYDKGFAAIFYSAIFIVVSIVNIVATFIRLKREG